jgi:hypothetical protein
MTPGGLHVQYLIPNLSSKHECLSIHSSLPLGPHHHAIPQNQRKQSLCRTEANCRPQAPLPNLLKKPSFSQTDFFTKLGQQIRLLPVPNFGVKNMHHKFICINIICSYTCTSYYMHFIMSIHMCTIPLLHESFPICISIVIP